MQEPVLSTDTITHAHVHRSTYILALCLVRIIILISKWKRGLSTRLHPHPDTNTPTSMHIYNILYTHRPVFVEIQVVPFVLVVGRNKAEGQVALPH